MRSDALAPLGGSHTAADRRLGATAGIPLVGPSTGTGWVEIAGFWRPAPSGAAAAPEATVEAAGFPRHTGLDAIWPNPTRGSLSIRFRIARTPAPPAGARIEIYDLLGRRLVRPVEGSPLAGVHSATWNGRDDRGHPLAAGRYYLRFTSGDHRETRPITILR